MNDFSDSYEEFKEDFDREVREELPSAVMERLWNFQGWMREHTDLSSGTVVDYLKDIARKIEEPGDDTQPCLPDDVDRTSAVKKYEKFRDSDYNNTER